MIVRLSAEDALCAVSVATLHMVRKVAKGRNSDHGGVSTRGMRDRWADAIIGTMGELALSRLLHLEWTPGGMGISHGDVAHRLEVRATDHPSGHLMVYPNDAIDALLVLMVGHYPEFRCAGWIIAEDAQRAEWWRPDGNLACWWVPQSALATDLEALA